jgi:hypothetical protein
MLILKDIGLGETVCLETERFDLVHTNFLQEEAPVSCSRAAAAHS